MVHPKSLPSRGAWIEITKVQCPASTQASLPSRGAWIEIKSYYHNRAFYPVAPLAGSVDRNAVFQLDAAGPGESLPSRGAWIEISSYSPFKISVTVAPLAGSVDRNPLDRRRNYQFGCRSPRGERG